MKKYQQLLLAIVSIVSFSCLLIYGHEYYKLRYVLEVLNFFGTPNASPAAPPQCNRNTNFKRLTVLPPDSPSAWQRISNSLYIYSAYREKVEDKEHVIAFAVGELSEPLNYGCYLSYDTSQTTKMGQFSFSALSRNILSRKNYEKIKPKAFVFYCDAEAVDITPVGVGFFKSSVNESSQGVLPLVNIQTSTALSNSTGICIMPAPFSGFNKSTYLEFLSFHQVIGINNFIAYGANNQYSLLSHIQQDCTHKVNLIVTQWNYPFFGDHELMKVIAENDCKIRTIGVFENVLILEWNQYFVPRYIFDISKIMTDLDLTHKTFKFQFSTFLFCNEYEDNKMSNFSTPHIFRKTKYVFPKSDILVPLYRPYLRTGHVQKVSKNIIAVQKYASCRDFKIKSGERKVAKIDTSIFKFQDKFLNSKLLRL